MRKLSIAVLLVASVASVRASTLQQLSLNDMIRQSTIIIHGKPQQTISAFHGSLLCTHYTVTVSETLKGTPAAKVDIGVPGGLNNGVRQVYAGAPTLVNGQDYVLFLWTSKTGLTQVIGLSQGLFAVVSNSSGQPAVVRAAITDTMLDAAGKPVSASDIQMTLADLRTLIQNTLSGQAK